MIVCRCTGNLAHLVRWGLLFAGLVCSAEAQTAQIHPVTIREAGAEAVEKNLNVLAEKYSVPIAEAGIVTAKLRPNPVLSVGRDHLDLLGTGYNAENGAGPAEFSI